MVFVDNQNIKDPRINLAIEEHLLRNVAHDEEILLFYINEPAVIIGRNQNTLEEIDPDFVKANGIHVVRRLSGGGAVFHDLGNLNFSFVTNGRHDLHNFAKFTDPVVRVLRELGVEAELRGSSDIFAGDKKISGNAQYSTPERMFSHGTLLFDTDIETMLKALNPRQMEIESKAVQSVRNFVTNVKEELSQPMDIYAFRQRLLYGIFGSEEIPTLTLDESDWEQIYQYRDERYANWAWNYGRSPKFNVRKSEQLPVGTIDARIDVEKGKINAIKLFGDFSGYRPVSELEDELVGIRYDADALAEALTAVDLTEYFGPLSVDEFVRFLT